MGCGFAENDFGESGREGQAKEVGPAARKAWSSYFILVARVQKNFWLPRSLLQVVARLALATVLWGNQHREIDPALQENSFLRKTEA